MTRLALAGVAGLVAAVALTRPPLTRADDPPVVTVTVVQTVQARIEGIAVGGWHARAVRNRRVRNRQHHELVALRHTARARARSGLVGLIRAFECIHSFEGPWHANTGNGYENGLQMDKTFQRQYGSWALRRFGPAWSWPPDVQLLVAMTAWWSGRGFRPWPQTSKACGL